MPPSLSINKDRMFYKRDRVDICEQHPGRQNTGHGGPHQPRWVLNQSMSCSYADAAAVAL
jgi:hypothetical protein